MHPLKYLEEKLNEEDEEAVTSNREKYDIKIKMNELLKTESLYRNIKIFK